MVLVSDGYQELPENPSTQFVINHLCSLSSIKKAAEDFSREVHHISSAKGVLYVHQGEMAMLPSDNLSDEPSMLASDDATSCVIVVFRLPRFHVIAHLDTQTRVETFLSRIAEHLIQVEDTVSVHLVGAFPDQRGLGESVLNLIIRFLLDSPVIFSLRTFCVAQLNVEHRTGKDKITVKACRVTGLLFDCAKDVAYAAKLSWEARGPAPALRLARLQTANSSITEVFDYRNKVLSIEPFEYRMVFRVDPNKLTVDSMKHLSTTPDQEPVTFFEGLRATLLLISRNPDWTVWFQTGPLLFRYNAKTHECSDRIGSNIPWIPLNASSTYALENALVRKEL